MLLRLGFNNPASAGFFVPCEVVCEVEKTALSSITRRRSIDCEVCEVCEVRGKTPSGLVDSGRPPWAVSFFYIFIITFEKKPNTLRTHGLSL